MAFTIEARIHGGQSEAPVIPTELLNLVSDQAHLATLDFTGSGTHGEGRVVLRFAFTSDDEFRVWREGPRGREVIQLLERLGSVVRYDLAVRRYPLADLVERSRSDSR